MNLVKTTVLSAITLAAAPATADDIFKGMRGPTNWQLDVRAAHNENDHSTTNTGTAILKYWDGDEFGKWFFANLNYKELNTRSTVTSGLSDVTIGGGPRGRMGNLHILPYGAVTIPSGSDVSSERTDTRAGILATYLAEHEAFEIDGSFERVWTGTNAKGFNAPDEYAAGAIVGGRTSQRTRLAGGIAGTFRDNGEYETRVRAVWRGTRSKVEHLEIIVDIGLKAHGLPKHSGVTIIYRRNL